MRLTRCLTTSSRSSRRMRPSRGTTSRWTGSPSCGRSGTAQWAEMAPADKARQLTTALKPYGVATGQVAPADQRQDRQPDRLRTRPHRHHDCGA